MVHPGRRVLRSVRVNGRQERVRSVRPPDDRRPGLVQNRYIGRDLNRHSGERTVSAVPGQDIRPLRRSCGDLPQPAGTRPCDDVARADQRLRNGFCVPPGPRDIRNHLVRQSAFPGRGLWIRHVDRVQRCVAGDGPRRTCEVVLSASGYSAEHLHCGHIRGRLHSDTVHRVADNLDELALHMAGTGHVGADSRAAAGRILHAR